MAQDPFHAVILDAGSSGTRLFIYHITPKHVEERKQGKVTELLAEREDKDGKKVFESFKKSPGNKGIQNLRTDIDTDINKEDTNIRYHLDSIFEQAKEFLDREKIPAKLYVLATGGVRDRLNLRQQLTLRNLVTNYIQDLESRFELKFEATQYTAISGAVEAKFGWVAANYFAKQEAEDIARRKDANQELHLDKRQVEQLIERPYQAGYVEMGGATAQIAFPVEARKVAEVENVAKSLNTVTMGIDSLGTLKEELQEWAKKKADSDEQLKEAEETEEAVDELKKTITRWADERAKAKLEATLEAKLKAKLEAMKKAKEAKEKLDSEALAKLEEVADGVSPGGDMIKLKQVAKRWVDARALRGEKLEAQMEEQMEERLEAGLEAVMTGDVIDLKEVVKQWGDERAKAEAEKKAEMLKLGAELEAEVEAKLDKAAAEAELDEELDGVLKAGSEIDKSKLKEGLKQWVGLDVELDRVMKRWCGDMNELKAAGEVVEGVTGTDVVAWVELNERAKMETIGNRKLFVASFPLGMDAGYEAYKQELFTTDLEGVNEGNVFYDPSKRDGYYEEDGNRIIKGKANARLGFLSNFGLTLYLVHSAQEQQFTDADVEAVRPLGPIIAKLPFIGASNFFYSFQGALNGRDLSFAKFSDRLRVSSKEKHSQVHKEGCTNKTSTCGDNGCKFVQGLFDKEVFRLYWALQALRTAFGLQLGIPGGKTGKDVAFTPYNGHGPNKNRFSWTLGTALLLASPDLENLE